MHPSPERASDLRGAYGEIRVLHDALALSGLARTGPILPPMSHVDSAFHAALTRAARDLLAAEMTDRAAPATAGV